MSKDSYMDDFKAYMNARKLLETDTRLQKMLTEYDSKVSELTKLMQTENYDAQRAIELTNDIDYLGDAIRANGTYQLLQLTFKKLQSNTACTADCSTCNQNCSHKHNQE